MVIQWFVEQHDQGVRHTDLVTFHERDDGNSDSNWKESRKELVGLGLTQNVSGEGQNDMESG